MKLEKILLTTLATLIIGCATPRKPKITTYYYQNISVKEYRISQFTYMGDEAINVFDEFDQTLLKKITSLSERWHVEIPALTIYDNAEPDGFYSFKTLNLSYGCFDTDVWKIVLLHEFGHYKYDLLNGEENKKFQKLFLGTTYGNAEFDLRNPRSEFDINKSISYTFKEGLFENIPDFVGHPHDNATELYASAFVIAELGLVDEYKRRYFTDFTQEQKRLANKIFEVVQR